MTDYWSFQNNTPLIGSAMDYNTYGGITSKSYAMYGSILSIGTAGVAGALGPKLPQTSLAQSISAMVFAAVAINTALNTSTLYSQESTWGYDSSPNLDYEVIQNWYADAAHTQFICTTCYYAAFV